MFHGDTYIRSNGGKWVRYDRITGKMVKGLHYQDGAYYYFDQTTGAMAHGAHGFPNGIHMQLLIPSLAVLSVRLQTTMPILALTAILEGKTSADNIARNPNTDSKRTMLTARQ